MRRPAIDYCAPAETWTSGDWDPLGDVLEVGAGDEVVGLGVGDDDGIVVVVGGRVAEGVGLAVGLASVSRMPAASRISLARPELTSPDFSSWFTSFLSNATACSSCE
jgi:hypothetical protein